LPIKYNVTKEAANRLALVRFRPKILQLGLAFQLAWRDEDCRGKPFYLIHSESLMCFLACLLVFPGQIQIIDSKEFDRAVQIEATEATVRILNGTNQLQGSGAIIGKKDGFVYVLTANHVVDKALQLEVSTFTVGSHPKPSKVFRAADVKLVAGDAVKDLALICIKTDKNLGTLPRCPKGAEPDKGGINGLAVGCEVGKGPNAVIVMIAGKKLVQKNAKTAHFWEVDGKTVEGRSGGPLIDKSGRLLGILSGTTPGKSYYCYTEEIRGFLKKHGFE
jgi:S1-C subfamily serine protease